MTETEEVNLWALSDLRTPWCIHVVATLRIANHIAGGINHIDDLAKAAACDRDVLHSVMGHLVGKGIFEEPALGQFALNEAAQPLLEPITRLSLDLDDIGGRFAYAWGSLLKYVRTGAPAYQEIFGLPFWEDLEAHPAIAASFDALIGPAGHGSPNPEFQITRGWNPIKTVVDVGGGTGAMLAEILRIHPHIQGILVDQPGTVARSGEIFQAAGIAGRVQVVGQSFFDPLPAKGDLYLLRGVLNDWPDREAAAILKRCAEAAYPAGRVVILKSVVPDETPKNLTIEMVLLGGKKRTITEFRDLALKADLKVIAAGQQPLQGGQAGGYFVVECQPVRD